MKVVHDFSSLQVAWLDLGHQHSSRAAQGATSLEEIPSRLRLGDNLLSQSLVVHTLVLV